MTEIVANGAALVTPDTELVERAARRRYTAAYKLGTVRKTDACIEAGGLGALLRREGGAES